MTEGVIEDEQDRLEQYGEPFNRECRYHDVDDLKGAAISGGDEFRVLHNTIQCLPSEFHYLYC